MNKKDHFIKSEPIVQSLHINRTKGTCLIKCLGILFKDKDSLQHVIYLPALELSGYGETLEKAKEMLSFSVTDFFNFIEQMPAKKMKAELEKLGWKQNKLRNKDYSKAFVDLDGNLKGFNAVEDKAELLNLEMAA